MATTHIETATMSVAQAARLLGISTRSAYRAVDAGQIPSIRLGRRIRVPTAKLHDMLGISTVPADSPPDRVPAATG